MNLAVQSPARPRNVFRLWFQELKERVPVP